VRRLLFLYLNPRPEAERLTTLQHREALAEVRNAETLSYNAVHGAPAWLRHLRFDAVVLHTTLLTMRWNIWFPQWKRRLDWLADVDAVKIAFPQDEYDGAEIHDRWLDELGVSVVCTVLDDSHRDELYPRLAKSATFYEVLTGYIDDPTAERFRRRNRPLAERPYDVVYRARHPAYWYGSHSQLKHRIGDAVLERAGAHGLRCDISTRAPETIFGDVWLDFLGSGRATIGTESGVSSLDRAGELRQTIGEMLQRDPALSFEDVAARMPPGWDDYRFFAISPRHLEAVITRTAQILVDGRYSGVLEPERHYIPVRRDFADLDEALERARDLALLEEIASRAYEEIYESGAYSSHRLTETLERILEEHAPARAPARPRPIFVAGGALAAIESEAERRVVGPAANVARVGKTGVREMLAGARLAAVDAEARRLLVVYLRWPEIRDYVSPREALADVLRVGLLRRAGNGDEAFAVSVVLDEERRRVVLRSHRDARADGAVSRERLETFLRTGAVDFAWDHSAVADALAFPLLRGHELRYPLPAGPHPLNLLSWIARRRPDQVVAALTPLLPR
jgi:hypothetical protein